ncbi:MAG TPA: hypothetical protein VL588_02940 [Bdellovibrionota bacterium]|jgi:hypothetical protein|nr:hypothetical protein [Bdellovibrionota bacterium]
MPHRALVPLTLAVLTALVFARCGAGISNVLPDRQFLIVLHTSAQEMVAWEIHRDGHLNRTGELPLAQVSPRLGGHPSGPWVYSVFTDASFQAAEVDYGSGALKSLGTCAAPSGFAAASDLKIRSAGDLAVLGGQTGGGFVAFGIEDINPKTGGCGSRSAATSDGATVGPIRSVAPKPSGDVFFASDTNSTVFKVAYLTSGLYGFTSLSPQSATATLLVHLAMDPLGLWAVLANEGNTSADIFTLSPGFSHVSMGQDLGDLSSRAEFNPSGTFIAIIAEGTPNTVRILPFDEGTGSMGSSIQTVSGFGGSVDAIAYSRDGKYAYVTDTGNHRIRGFSVGSTGEWTELSSSPFDTLPYTLPEDLTVITVPATNP